MTATLAALPLTVVAISARVQQQRGRIWRPLPLQS